MRKQNGNLVARTASDLTSKHNPNAITHYKFPAECAVNTSSQGTLTLKALTSPFLGVYYPSIRPVKARFAQGLDSLVFRGCINPSIIKFATQTLCRFMQIKITCKQFLSCPCLCFYRFNTDRKLSTYIRKHCRCKINTFHFSRSQMHTFYRINFSIA